MDYQFEALGPDRFQQFCQALLVSFFPDLICFPIGQPDGGRDALLFMDSPNRVDIIVYQVKFVRRPLAEEDPHKWLVKIVKGEATKVKKLIPKGAKHYYLLTNVPGTAHPESGSIDKVKQILQSEFEIPADCWWRDDISRRLDTLPELRWAYPEIMTGVDLLHYLIGEGLSESRERRISVMKAFVRDQYEMDKEVRFKQIELQNKLLDLFIDVPIGLREIDHRETEYRGLQHVIYNIMRRQLIEGDEIETSSTRVFYDREENLFLGAASFLLDPLVQKRIPSIVLEGAPGQGKSTIAQYVCQVHRMRLLNETIELEAVPDHHKLSPIRFPIKIDLRDLASWLSQKDPFSSVEYDIPLQNWHRSLEAFLAALIRHYSGGSEFNVTDLHAVTRVSAILLVFDGLDEVADISKRQDVVDEIVKGVNRLKENAVSLQVIVTSRPAAFANSPGLPSDVFHYCQLEALTRPLIDEYAERWLKARRLQSRESAEVKQILEDKLDQPHLRDLARNPMQLAILLSLIHNRGPSLPDKRTELYDNYVELFFSREAQKSAVVRDHRDLLVNIHRYLAWVLQSEAEQGDHRGSINIDRLHKLLTEYLTREGYDTTLSKTLFTGMVERVVALVSRVEGSFEFEVQPLREYFAARYLYETAPYSPPGSPRNGNLLDRFDAIARDFYWLNVTRFYSGCFSIGELPSLADRLDELVKEDGYRHTNHPRLLAATLLADWVFAQHPRSMRFVVSLILDGLGLRFLLASSGRRPRSETPIMLPKQCGRDELVNQCFSILRSHPSPDYATEVIELIQANSTPIDIKPKWFEETFQTTGSSRTQWIEYGLWLGILSQLTVSELNNIVADNPEDQQRIILMYRARQIEFCQSSEQRSTVIVQAILDRDLLVPINPSIESDFDQLANALDINRYAVAFKSKNPVALKDIWIRERELPDFEQMVTTNPEYGIGERCAELLNTVNKESLRGASEWASDLTPWDNIVEKSRSIWGEQWVHFQFANVASGIKSLTETCTDYPNLLDKSKSLCRRARYARLRSGATKWWAKQFDNTVDQFDLILVNLILLTWGSPRTISELVGRIETTLEVFSPLELQRLVHLVRRTHVNIIGLSRENTLSIELDTLPQALSYRTAAVLGTLAEDDSAYKIYLKYLQGYNGKDSFIWRFCQRSAMHLLFSNSAEWQEYLFTIERSYTEGRVSGMGRLHARYKGPLPLLAARTITEQPDRFPTGLVTLAESLMRKDVASKIVPVGEIAQKNHWFINS